MILPPADKICRARWNIQLYHDFMKATNSKFVGEGSFNRFQVAVEGMRRKMKTLTYKDNGSIEGAMYKGRVQ